MKITELDRRLAREAMTDEERKQLAEVERELKAAIELDSETKRCESLLAALKERTSERDAANSAADEATRLMKKAYCERDDARADVERKRAVIVEDIAEIKRLADLLAQRDRRIAELEAAHHAIIARHDKKCTCGGCCIARGALTGNRGDDLSTAPAQPATAMCNCERRAYPHAPMTACAAMPSPAATKEGDE